jgi:hypothetical protein
MQVLTAPANFGHSDCERIVGGALTQPVLPLRGYQEGLVEVFAARFEPTPSTSSESTFDKLGGGADSAFVLTGVRSA